VKIPNHSIENPEFNLANWYNQKRARHFNFDNVEEVDGPETRMGDALAIVAQHLLENGVDSCYPNVSSPTGEPRFHISKATPFGREYLIQDLDLDKSVVVQRELLIDDTTRKWRNC